MSLTATVAGCSELEGIQEGSSDDVPGFHKDQLMDADVGVSTMTREDGDAIVEYQTTASTEEEARSQVGPVATEIGDAISDPPSFETGVSTVYVTGFDEDETELITFSIRSQWAVDYAEDDISADEYRSRVSNTVEVTGFEDDASA